MTPEYRLACELLRGDHTPARHADDLADAAEVERDEARRLLRAMADPFSDWPIIARRDLGPDYYEATGSDEDRARWAGLREG